MTDVAGIQVPSNSPIFLAIVALHVLLGLVAVLSGAIAMLSPKRHGRHPTFGAIYFWCLSAAVGLATALSVVRWKRDYPLFLFGAVAFTAALIARTARRQLWRRWVPWHITGMGISYISLLTAFYIDNGKSLPLWKQLPTISYWLLPTVIGVPLIVRALLRHRSSVV